MSGFEVAMVGSTQTQIFQIEDLLRSLGTTRRSQDAASARSSSFDSRPIIAAFLAFFVFAPGCAAAAVFLMRADGNIPPITTPDSNQPFVAKSDRLPLVQWSAEAVENADPKNDIRFAVAETLADSAFLDSLLIRGSLEDGTVTPISDSPSLPNFFASRDKPSVETPRPKRIVSRVKPPKLLAAVAPPEPPQPSFFEKLFGPHVN